MKKKLKDLTVKELKEICVKNEDCILCPIRYLCEKDPYNYDGRVLNKNFVNQDKKEENS